MADKDKPTIVFYITLTGTDKNSLFIINIEEPLSIEYRVVPKLKIRPKKKQIFFPTSLICENIMFGNKNKV